MRDFFKSWRRKIGMMALVLACVFMAAWVRSLFVHDFIKFDSYFEKGGLAGIVTARNSLNVMAYEMSVTGIDFDVGLPTHHHDVSQMFSFFTPVYQSTATLIVVNQTAASRIPVLQPTPILVIPYWSITVPLTLVSLWLLLSKPGRSVQKKLARLIAKEGV